MLLLLLSELRTTEKPDGDDDALETLLAPGTVPDCDDYHCSALALDATSEA
jgi:hypothetical protein